MQQIFLKRHSNNQLAMLRAKVNDIVSLSQSLIGLPLLLPWDQQLQAPNVYRFTSLSCKFELFCETVDQFFEINLSNILYVNLKTAYQNNLSNKSHMSAAVSTETCKQQQSCRVIIENNSLDTRLSNL